MRRRAGEVLMDNCKSHEAHVEHFKRNDKRIDELETDMDEIRVLVTKIDTLVASMNKMYWVVVAAVAGSLATAFMALIIR